MTEPRARTRTKGHSFDPSNLSDLLYAYGTAPPTLPSTLTTLDEILTDFIIETCHYAALSASYSRRQKIKVDDFKFVLRRDERLLGRVLEQLWREKRLKDDRKVADFNQMGGVEGVVALAELAEAGGVDKGEMKEKKKGKAGKKKRKRADGDQGEERTAKRMAS